MSIERDLSVGVLGAGAVGTALAALLRDAGHKIEHICTRTPESLADARRFLDLPDEACTLNAGEWCRTVDLLLLTVPDDHIESVASDLAERGGADEHSLVVHCSGAHSARDLLGDLEEAGADVGSFHPLQTVPDPASGVRSIPGSWVAVDGTGDVPSRLKQLARDVGCRPIRVPDGRRPLYHASAVVACNLTIALLSVAGELIDLSTDDLDRPLEPLRPLVEQSVENAFEKGALDAITGPAVRGDRETLASHVRALDEIDGTLSELYVSVTRRCLEMGRENGSLDPDRVEEIRETLNQLLSSG